MKNKLFYILIIMALTFFCENTAVYSQTTFTIQESRDNRIRLSGTSTFTDWSMQASTFSGNAKFDMLPGNDIAGLQSLNFSIIATKLKSSKNALNKNAYKALKTDRFKTIDYVLISSRIIGVKNFIYQIRTIGNLTIAGVTKVVAIELYCTVNKNGSITSIGKYDIKMTDYNVEPPYFFDGLMSTSESVAIEFSMRFER